MVTFVGTTRPVRITRSMRLLGTVYSWALCLARVGYCAATRGRAEELMTFHSAGGNGHIGRAGVLLPRV